MIKLIVHVTQIDKMPERGVVNLVVLLPEEDCCRKLADDLTSGNSFLLTQRIFAHQSGESVKSITSLAIMTCWVSGMSITALCEQGGVQGGALGTSVVHCCC